MFSSKREIRREYLKTSLLMAAPVLVILLVLFLVFQPRWQARLNKKKLKNLNVILITIDTLRWDYVSLYEGRKAHTPTLDRLAEEGVWFKNCIAQTPLTLPSHTTILSGTYPLNHLVTDNSGLQVPDRLNLISEILRNRGFVTAAFIGSYVLNRNTGMSRGFGHYADEFDVPEIFSPENLEKRAEMVLSEARSWLEANKNKEFFVWIHLYDPHSPYTPPTPYKEKFPDNPYRGEVEYVDDQVDQFVFFLKGAGLYDKCLLMITSDHGEGLGDHGEQEHGFFLYESTVRVPLIIRAPFQFPVKRVDLIVEHVDLVPTILESLAIPIPGSCQGTSFLNLVFDLKRDKPNMAYSETYYPRRHFGWSDLKTYYSENWKYIQAPTEELYDLSQDRSETRNLASLRSQEKKMLKDRIQKFIKIKSANALSTAQVKPLDKKDIERLASLGYSASVVRTEGRSNLPDPKDKISLVNDLESAKKHFDQQEYDVAIPLIQRIIQNDPGVIYAYHLLGNCYFQKKMYSRALENYRYVLSCQPDFIIVMYDVVECLSRMERYDAAIEEGEKFLKAYPSDYTLLKKLASLYYAQKRFDQALDLLKTVLQMDETEAEVLRLIVEISISRREFESARICVERALQINPRINHAYFLLGQIESASGNPRKAIDLFKEELARDPQNSQAAFYLGEGLRLAGNFPAAILYYRKTIELDPEFNLPYFIIAKHLAMGNIQIPEAIRLCKQGISIEPKNQYTLLGYSLLLQIYSQLGDSEKVAFYTLQAGKLQALLNHGKADPR